MLLVRHYSVPVATRLTGIRYLTEILTFKAISAVTSLGLSYLSHLVLNTWPDRYHRTSGVLFYLMVGLACLISPLANRTDQAGGQRSEEKKKEGRKEGA